MVVTSFRSRLGSGFTAYVVGLGLSLGLAPVARGCSMVADRVRGPARAAQATQKAVCMRAQPETEAIRGGYAMFACSFLHYNYSWSSRSVEVHFHVPSCYQVGLL